MQFRKNDDLVSVIVPIYGEDEYLDQCIESIVNQTYQYLEIILVDDGSTDQCPLICDQWAKKDERIRVIHKKNGGLVSARKAGMDISTGAYIGYIDGDDWVDLDYYEKLVDVARKSKADAIITGYQKELHNKSIACYNHLDEGTYRKRELLDIVYPKMMFDEKTAQGTITTYVWNKLFRKENIYNAQMSVDNDIVIGEDAACIYPALLSCNVVVVSGMLGYHYRIRFNSILRTVEKERKRILQMQILQNCFKNILQRSPYRIMIYNQFCDYFFMQLIMMSDILAEEYPLLDSRFPFCSLPTKGKIVIYNAGAYGRHVFRQLSANEDYEIVGWIDENYEQYCDYDYPVTSIGDVLRDESVFYVIASVYKDYIRDAIEKLKKIHVSENRIVSIYQSIHLIEQQLQDIGLVQLDENK